MPSIYVICEGEPPNREIHAAFSTRKAAQAALYLTSRSCRVEEYPVDAPLPTGPKGHSLWTVERMRGSYGAYRANAYRYTKTEKNIVERLAGYDSCNVLLWARNEQHALKLAKELFDGERA